MEYLFVFANGGWWLKVDSVEKLIDYHQKTGNRYAGAVKLYIELYEKAKKHGGEVMDAVMEYPLEERVKLYDTRDFKYMQAAITQAQCMEGATIFDGFRGLDMGIGMKQLQDIKTYGATYINCVGGSTFSLNYTQFYRKKELVFPNFRKEDIRVEQFSGGTHWYAFIGDMQVRDGDVLKWNTRKEAYDKAVQMVEL